MKLVSANIKNLKSYYPEEEINFKKDINIFVGPNSGGKSNLFEILQGALNLIVFSRGNLTQNNDYGKFDQQYGHKPYKLTQRTPDPSNLSSNVFDSHFSHTDQSSNLRLVLEIEEHDITLVRELIAKFELIRQKIDQLVVDAEFLVQLIERVSTISDIDSFLGKKAVFDMATHTSCILSTDSDFIPETKDHFERLVNLLRNVNLYYEISLKIPEIPGYPIFSYLSPHRFIGQINHQSRQTLSIGAFDTHYSNKVNQNKEDQKSFLEGLELRVAYLYHQNSEILDNFKGYLSKYLNISCEVSRDDTDSLSYTYIVKFLKHNRTPARLSSGEKEFFNLICGLVLTGLKNGIVLLDEPELHLHSQWQQIILDLIHQLSNESNVQFFIITHSPKLIDYKVLPNTFRVSMQSNNTSKVINPSIVQAPAAVKDIVQFINTTNNEKAFFAQKVVLVEGVSDLIVYADILRKIKKTEQKDTEVEIVEVGSKYTLGKIRDFLDSWEIDNYIIGDFDFLKDLKKASNPLIRDRGIKSRLIALSPEIDGFITFSPNKLRQILCGSPTKDAVSLVELISSYDQLPQEEFREKLSQIIEYIRTQRATQMAAAPVLSPALIEVLDDLANDEGILIIQSGALETVFPSLADNKVENALRLIETLNIDTIPPYLRKWFKEIL